jgi:hypothetical protein
MAEKEKRNLLLPSGRKTQAERAASLKHNPIEEFRGSLHRTLRNDRPTRLVFPAVGFKAALGTAALDMPATKKSQIGRLTWVLGDDVPIWGIPELYMAVVRNSDLNRTADVRTRAILREWATEISVSFARPLLTSSTVLHLLAAAGMTVGIGDYRQEKGKGSYGQFELVDDKDARWQAVVKAGGRKDQDAAIELATPYDADSQEMLAWYMSERTRREAEPKLTRRRGNSEALEIGQ